MNRTRKLLGIVAFLAIISLSFTGCPAAATDPPPPAPPPGGVLPPPPPAPPPQGGPVPGPAGPDLGQGPFVAATGIPALTVNTVRTGGTITLPVLALPAGASNRGITWAVYPTSALAAISGNVLTAGNTPGALTIRGTVTNGTAIGTDFVGPLFTISVVFVPVTSIPAPAVTSAQASGTIELPGQALPTTATNRNITWALYPAGQANLGGATISAGGLNVGATPGPRSFTIRGTAANGTATGVNFVGPAVTISVPAAPALPPDPDPDNNAGGEPGVDP